MPADVLHYHYTVDAGDLTHAGAASSDIKRKLKQMHLSPQAVRRVAIAMYEGEINMIIHADGGVIDVDICPEGITMVLADHGPGIPNVEQAMQEGWSTAGEMVHNLGFGAGMGLPNMRNNSDEMKIDSVVGVGTTVTMRVNF